RREVGRIEALGVKIVTGKVVTREEFVRLRKVYDAVFLACGFGRERPLNIPGEHGPGVEEGLDFLRRVRSGERPNVTGISLVIGGGNTAVDVARTVVRLGGQAVIVYRRRRQDMPAFAEEIAAAREEGVELRELLAPVSMARDGETTVAVFQRMKITGTAADGRGRIVADGVNTVEMRVSRVFIAAGAEAEEPWYMPPGPSEGVVRLAHSVVTMPDGGAPVVYGGDVANRELNVTTAIASGKEAALALDIYFRHGPEKMTSLLDTCRVGDGNALSLEIYRGGARKGRSRHVVSYGEVNTDYFHFEARVVQPRLLPEERRSTFDEIEMRISAHTAMREAGRCFNCGICNGCDNCWLFCPDVSVHRDRVRGERWIDYDFCKGCGLCVVECPRHAMTLREEGTDEDGH
ncbi:MAG: FAD-dependent oxidoreductase, partial [Syntrophales bacterium]|nr:FAD-dependent oxidoreductase [Syntrophales bacterium]